MKENKDIKKPNIEYGEDETVYVECDMCGGYVDEYEIKEGMCDYCFRMNVGNDY